MSEINYMYLLSSRRNEALFPRAEPVCFGRALLQLTESVWCRILREEDREICLAGLCVDSLGEFSREQIPEMLLRAGRGGFSSVVEAEARLAGRYILIFTQGAEAYILHDATGAMQVFYHTGEEQCAASWEALVAKALSLPVSEEDCSYHAGSDYTQAMPYDRCCYQNVRCLLPGHSLCLNSGKVNRYWLPPAPTENTEAVLEATARQIDAITCAYAREVKLLCPITGGWDSRTNLSFLLKNGLSPETYTLYHPGFTDQSADIAIPRQICSRFELVHREIPDLPEDESAFQAAAEILGPYVSRRAICLARTIGSVYGSEYAVLTGDNMDQIGKYRFGRRLPTFAATAGFLTCKLHSPVPGIRRHVAQQLREYSRTGCRKAAFDLFALESRCGRWASQATTIYDIMGVQALNLFNCRMVLNAWMSLSKKERSRKMIHRYYLRRNVPELLEYPFNAPGWQDRMKKSAFLYWIATYGKFFLANWRWLRKK